MDTVNVRIFQLLSLWTKSYQAATSFKTLKAVLLQNPLLPSMFNKISSCVFHSQVSQSLATLHALCTNLGILPHMNPYEKKK